MASKHLGTLRPADTNAHVIFSNVSTAIVKSIFVCNTTALAATYRIFYAPHGVGEDQETAIYYDVSLAANTTTLLDDLHLVFDSRGQGVLVVRVGTASALTFTATGFEF